MHWSKKSFHCSGLLQHKGFYTIFNCMHNCLLGKKYVTWNGCKSFVYYYYLQSIAEKKRQLVGTPKFLPLSTLGNILESYEICNIGVSFHKLKPVLGKGLASTKASKCAINFYLKCLLISLFSDMQNLNELHENLSFC
jgi:hypothetical protein